MATQKQTHKSKRAVWKEPNTGYSRLIERDYLQTLSDKMTLERWGKIVNRALSDAEKGDSRARDWVSKHALGADPMTLIDLAMRETFGVASWHEIAAKNANECRSSYGMLSLARVAAERSKEERNRMMDGKTSGDVEEEGKGT